MPIIGRIVWNPQTPTAGQSVKIDVCGPDGKPYANQQVQYVGINGVAGSAQFLQFPFAGDQKVFITALADDGTEEQAIVVITVVATEPSPTTQAIIADPANRALTTDQIAWLKATNDVYILTVAPQPPFDSPYKVTFRLLPLSKFVPPPASPEQPFTTSASKPIPSTIVKPPTVAFTGATRPNTSDTSIATPLGTYDTYVWDFGDGSTATTNSPSVNHDFKPSLSTTREFHQFDVTVTGTRRISNTAPSKSDPIPGLVSLGSWTRTLSVHNTYVRCKIQGYVIPTVTVGGWATKVGTNFAGTAVISNNEPVPITLVSRLFIPVLKDSDALAVPTVLEAVKPSIVVPANGSVTVPVVAPFAQVPADALGFAAVFTEQPVITDKYVESASRLASQASDILRVDVKPVASSPDKPFNQPTNPIAGLKVRATAHFLVQPEYRGNTSPLIGSINVADVLDQPDILKNILGHLPLGLDASKANTLAALGLESRGKAPAGIAAVKPTAPLTPPRVPEVGPAPDPVPGNEVMPPVAVGNQCDPDNLPENIPPNLVCQITPKTQTIETNAQFLNARKGDVVLCPSVGAASLVDNLFLQLTPPQLYGHSGIMTRNYEQITHCTASQDRLQSYTVGDILSNQDEGFQPEVLKYAWPGVITQTVQNAVNGEDIPDPASSSGQTYHFQDFLGTPSSIYVGNQFVIIPPVVVKPDPVLETPAVRTLLTKVADDAYANTGRFHYRFYCFTNPAATGLTAPATGMGSASAWAEGTRAAVCASFIWMMMKENGVNAVGKNEYASLGDLSSYAKNHLQVLLDPNGRTLDGLFYYTLVQREKCAWWLWEQMINFVSAVEGWLGRTFTSATFYYADQLCNAFAADDTGTPSDPIYVVNQPFASPGDANAVSPENFLAWNGPGPNDGVLGYSEPLIYFPKSLATVPIYKWASASQYGKLTGHVYLDGKPAEGVTVQIAGTNLLTGTGKNGSYSFDNVLYGPYAIKAQKEWDSGPTINGVKLGVPGYAKGQVSVNVDNATVVAPDIELTKPDDPHVRSIAITGHASLDCSVYDFWTGSNHYDLYPQIFGQVDVGVGNVVGSWAQVETVHSLTATFSADITYLPDDSVDITFFADLDEPGGRTLYVSFNVPSGMSATVVIGDSNSIMNGKNGYFYNGSPDLEAKNDTVCCSITFTNNEWTS